MKDQLSAFLDGGLDDQTSRSVLESMSRDPALRDKWGEYCLIGDVLRGDTSGAPDFTSRVMQSLRSEPTLLARGAPAAAKSRGPRHPMISLAASVAGVAAVGLVAYTLYPRADDTAPIASADATPQTAEALARHGVSVATGERDELHHKYVFVHQAMNGGGPIPGAVHYVRTVSDRGEPRR